MRFHRFTLLDDGADRISLHTTPQGRTRSFVRTMIVVPFGLLIALGLASCDTGDGKTLRPVDPNATTVPTTLATIDTGTLSSVALDGSVGAGTGLGDGGFLPGNSISADEFTDDGFELFAPWLDGASIDTEYTCDGADIQPAFSWKSPPADTVQLAFVLVDESSIIEGSPFVHWVLAGVEPSTISIIEGEVPTGAVVAANSFGVSGWSGPCPPVGDGPHTYRLTMYALNQQVELADGVLAADLLDFIDAVSIGSTDLTATYER